MRKLSTSVFIIFGILECFSQSVGIGTASPNPNAALEIVQGTKPQGFLIPRMKASDRIMNMSLTTTDRGMMVYDIDSLDIMQWDGVNWRRLGAADTDWQIVSNELFTNRNVGINTNPMQPLEVGGDVVFGGGSSKFDSGEEFVQIKSQSESWYMAVMNGTNGDNNDFFITNDLSKTPNLLHMEPSGNIGVGTNTPDVKLDINGAIAIRDTVAGTDIIIGNKSYYKVEGTGNMTLTKGLTPGQLIVVHCIAGGFTIADNTTIVAQGASVFLGVNDTATFIWDGVNKWIQTAYSDN